MKVRRLNPSMDEYVFEHDGTKIAVDCELPENEQKLLGYLLNWCHVTKGEINKDRWRDYVNNKNGPVWDEAEGDYIYKPEVEWTLDFWEFLFDKY